MSRLGITPAALASQTAATSFMGQISTTARGSNAADIANDLKEVFGRGMMGLFGVLQTNFSGLEADMKSVGAIMNDQVIVALKKFELELGLLGTIITSQLAPYLVDFGMGLMKAYQFIATSAAGAAVNTVGWHWKDWLLGRAPGEGLFGLPIGQLKIFGMTIGNPPFPGTGTPGADVYSDLQKIINAFTKAIAAIKPEAITGTSPGEKSHKERALKDESNSLIKVGNFLGASRDTIGNLQQQTAQHTAAIVTHTKTTADELKAMHQIFDKLVDKPRDLQLQHGETIFPTG
jgi:hypothetical protein